MSQRWINIYERKSTGGRYETYDDCIRAHPIPGESRETFRLLTKEESDRFDKLEERIRVADKYIKFLEKFWGIDPRLSKNPKTKTAREEYLQSKGTNQ